MVKWIVPLVILGLFVIIGGWFGMSFISISNQDVDMHTQFKAQQKANEVVFDKVWKTIQSKAGITEKYSKDFKSIYTEIMDKRYNNDNNVLFKWITEQNPNFSIEMYKDISLSVEANRAEFQRVQEKLIDLDREHENLRQKFPSNIFLSIKNCKPFDIKIVTSTKTDQAFSTGKEDDVNLFNK